jgi:hypothetical protein
MLNLIIRINHFFLSEKYRFFDIFLGSLGLFYCFYSFFANNVIEYFILGCSLFGIILGFFDITRKINKKIQSRMLGLKN